MLERVAIDLMLSAGLRVSEILAQQSLRVNVLGQIFVFGSKGSDSKLVTPLYFKKFWLSRSGSHVSPFIHISRFSLYRYLRANDISLRHGAGKNMSVTHSMRHLHVYLLEIMSLSEIQMSEVIGHKSLRSLKFYLHGEK
jgi:site-specific recombinase XerC